MADGFRAGLIGLLPRLRRFGIALTGSAADADDLVQGACARALTSEGQLRDKSRLDAWIFGIMRNMWVDEVRSRRVRRHDELSTAHDVVGDDGEATTEGRITLSAVRRALADMEADMRAVLVLVCVDGLSYKEAATVLNIPIGTVMSRLSRARIELQDRLHNTGKGSRVTAFPTRPGRGQDRSS